VSAMRALIGIFGRPFRPGMSATCSGQAPKQPNPGPPGGRWIDSDGYREAHDHVMARLDAAAATARRRTRLRAIGRGALSCAKGGLITAALATFATGMLVLFAPDLLRSQPFALGVAVGMLVSAIARIVDETGR